MTTREQMAAVLGHEPTDRVIAIAQQLETVAGSYCKKHPGKTQEQAWAAVERFIETQAAE